MTARGDQEQRRTPAGLKRRAELMEAAVLLAGENGFGRTRVSDIVGRVGVGQGVFYWYFDSKDALFREIFEDTGRRLRLFQAAFISSEPDPRPPDREGDHRVVRLHRPERARVRRARPRLDEVRASSARGPGRSTSSTRSATSPRRSGRAPSATWTPTYPARAISGVVDHLARDYFRRRGDLDQTIQEGDRLLPRRPARPPDDDRRRTARRGRHDAGAQAAARQGRRVAERRHAASARQRTPAVLSPDGRRGRPRAVRLPFARARASPSFPTAGRTTPAGRVCSRCSGRHRPGRRAAAARASRRRTSSRASCPIPTARDRCCASSGSATT